MSRDLENFAKYFLSAYQVGAAGAEHAADRTAKTEAAKLKYQHDMAREAREDRKTNQWIRQSDAYMNYLNRKGTGAGKAPGVGAGASKFDTAMAGRGIAPDNPLPNSSLTVNMPEPLAPPPGMPPSSGGGGGTEYEARGGMVGSRRAPAQGYAGGTTGPGSGYGTIAAPPGMRRGGRVRRFAGGGSIESGADMSLDEAAKGGPGGKKGASTASAIASGLASGAKAGTDATKGKGSTTDDIRPTGPVGSGAGGSYTTADVQPGGVLNLGMWRGGRVQRFDDGGKPVSDDRLLHSQTGSPTTDFRLGGGRVMLGGNYDPSGRYATVEGGYEHPVGRNLTLGVQGNIGKNIGPDGASSKPDWGVGLRGRLRFAGGGLFPATSDAERAEIARAEEAKRAAFAERRRKLGVDPVPPNNMTLFPPVTGQERDQAVKATGEQIPVPERDLNLFPPTSDEGRARMVEQDRQNREATADRRAIRAGSQDSQATQPNDSPDQYYPDDTYPRTKPAAAPTVPMGSPDESFRDDPRTKEGYKPPPARTGGGGGRRGGPEPWLDLGNQNRTKAFDYEKDYADPRNIHAVDRWGRSRAEGQAPAAAQAGRPVDLSGGPMGGQGLNPQGSGGPRAGMSTNNAANDYEASKGASNFAEHTFHLGSPDKNSAKGYEALASGHGAPTIATIDQMRRAVDPEGKMPPNELMRNLRNEVYKFYMDKGDKAKADKSAFEVSQFGNVMAKGHGTNAQKMLAKGDVAGATNEIAAGYNWLPNGHTVHIDPSGKMAVVEGPDGKIIHQIPLTPDILKQVSDGMTHGVFNWDVMNGGGALPAPALNAPGAAPPMAGGAPGGGAPGGAGAAISTAAPTAPAVLPSTVSGAPPGAPPVQPPGQPTRAPVTPSAQPSAASAGPAQTPAAPTATPPPAARPSAPPAGPPQAIQPVAPSSLAPTQLGGQTPAPPVQTPPVQTPPAKPPATPAPPVKTPPAETKTTETKTTETKPPEQKEETQAERAKRVDAIYKENPDYVPQPSDGPPIRRASLDQKPIDPRTWDAERIASEQKLEKELKEMYATAKETGDAKPASIARAVAHFNAEHKERLAEINRKEKRQDDVEDKLNRQESARVQDRKGGKELTDADTAFKKLAENDYKKWLEFDPKVESKKKEPNQTWASVHQSPLRYMPTEASRAQLTNVARLIWQHNPHTAMDPQTAYEYAKTFTSFVGEHSPGDMNGNKGDKGRYFRAIGYDPLGNIVLHGERGINVHVPKDGLTMIRELRQANHNHFKQEMKDQTLMQRREVGTADILNRTVGGLSNVITGGLKSKIDEAQ